MRSLKEFIAWGGVTHDSLRNPQELWPVDQHVHAFFLRGYTRGWRVSAHSVNLDEGTALFAKRTDVKHWSSKVVTRLEKTHSTTLQAVDVHGYDPRVAKRKI